MSDDVTLRQLRPVHLLVQMYCSFDGALRHHCIPFQPMYRRFGADIADARCANCNREVYLWGWVPFVEGHPETGRMLARLSKAGVETRVGNYTDPGFQGRVLSVDTRPRTLRIVRRLAKMDLGVCTRAEGAEFDRRFNLWFNQHYPPDWKDWQERYPLVEAWP